MKYALVEGCFYFWPPATDPGFRCLFRSFSCKGNNNLQTCPRQDPSLISHRDSNSGGKGRENGSKMSHTSTCLVHLILLGIPHKHGMISESARTKDPLDVGPPPFPFIPPRSLLTPAKHLKTFLVKESNGQRELWKVIGHVVVKILH